MHPSRVRGWKWCPSFLGTSQAAVGEGGIDSRSVQAAVQDSAETHSIRRRGHARQTVADGRVRRTRREGPIYIPVTRGHGSTRCADNSEDRSKCDADSVTDERVARCRGRAQTRSQECRSTADPREQGHSAAMPRSTTDLGSRGHQAVSHGPLAAWRKHGEGYDCGPPVCGEHQLGAGCLPVRKYARCMLSPQHTRPAPFRPDSCGTVTAATRAVPRCISNHVVTVARGVTHAEVEASQPASRRTMAKCFRRGSMPACRGRPSSVPAVWDGRCWSESM
ncbi:hypothetical protein TCDM_07890 [Trypanosoma cruzi Dm28c]|uniref:Uncharacterized protein n=1 Tax=Trypanosoma cruzi Dm28c TaxID=1416333 RepID=V5BI35_TRYCR|nr:hypothetical protein TCDM_07890 [Trypanosoma cruzi Dm28c]